MESPEADPLIAMGEIAGVQCQPSGAGLLACKAPGYEISGADHACAEDGASFGQVFDDAVTLVDRFPADGATPIAQLPKGQFLCVQFVAESVSGGDGWVYVTAVAPSLISRCSGNATCGAGGLAPKWAGATPVGECKVGVEGRYAQACPAGWLPRAAVEEFSMGL